MPALLPLTVASIVGGVTSTTAAPITTVAPITTAAPAAITHIWDQSSFAILNRYAGSRQAAGNALYLYTHHKTPSHFPRFNTGAIKKAKMTSTEHGTKKAALHTHPHPQHQACV